MSGDFNFECDKCPRTFKLEEFYEKHKKVHELKKQHRCDVCGFVYGARHCVVQLICFRALTFSLSGDTPSFEIVIPHQGTSPEEIMHLSGFRVIPMPVIL